MAAGRALPRAPRCEEGHGHLAAICFAALYTLALGVGLAQGVALLAPAAMIASAVTWATGVAAIAFILARQPWPYYEGRPPVSQSPTTVA